MKIMQMCVLTLLLALAVVSCQRLEDRGVNVEDEDKASIETDPILKAAEQGNGSEFENLLKRESDPRSTLSSRRTRHGRTALHLAASNGHNEIVKVILGLGLDPNIADQFGAGPLDEASSKAGVDTVRILVQGGAKVDAVSGILRCTALHNAVFRSDVDIVRYLVSQGADVNRRTYLGMEPVFGKYNFHPRNLRTPLQLAKQRGNQEVIDILTKAGAK